MAERERGQKDKKTGRERRAAWQAGRPTQLAESVPVYASEGSRYSRAVRVKEEQFDMWC